MGYKHCLQLYKLYNSNDQSDDWVDINFNQNFNNREKNVMIHDVSRLRIGKKKLSNRLSIIMDIIELSWLNRHLQIEV